MSTYVPEFATTTYVDQRIEVITKRLEEIEKRLPKDVKTGLENAPDKSSRESDQSSRKAFVDKLKQAVIDGQTSLVIEMLKANKEKNLHPDVHMLILTAVKKGNLDMLNALLEDGRLDASWENNWLVKLALSYVDKEGGHEDVMKRLLEEPSVRDKLVRRTGFSAYHVPVEYYEDIERKYGIDLSSH
jgi:hypothetical protein